MSVTALTYIFFAALTAALLYVILRLFPKYKVYNLHGLTFNYFTASLCSYYASGTPALSAFTDQASNLYPALMIGFLFITVFYCAALSAQMCGVTVTSIAGKMSMVIPITFAFFYFDDHVTFLKITGILLAVAAVYFSAPKSGENKVDARYWFLPLLVFTGSGIVDTSIKLSQFHFIRPDNENLFICLLFGSAGIIGTLWSVAEAPKKKVRLTLNSIAGGIVLGVVNYFSLFFLVRSLAADGMESSLVFSVVNLLVVMISAFIALLFFREKPDKRRITGLALALLAIIILYF